MNSWAPLSHGEDLGDARSVLSIDSARSLEAGHTYFTLRLSEAASDAVTVDYATITGTAEREDLVDYYSWPLDSRVVFAAAETVKTVAIYVRSDSIDELDQSFFLELRDPDGATFGGGNRTLTEIGWALDNDGLALNRTVAVSGADVREDPGGQVFVSARRE